MLRFYTKFTAILLIIAASAAFAAVMVGRWQHGDLLVYVVNQASSPAITVEIMDLSHRHTVQLFTLPQASASSLVNDMRGRFIFADCSDLNCDLWLWDGQSLDHFTNSQSVSEGGASWSSDGRLAYMGCNTRRTCDVWLWDGR